MSPYGDDGWRDDSGRGRFRAVLSRMFGDNENPLGWAITLGSVAGNALAHRSLDGSPHLDVRTGLRSLVIEADPPIPYQVDGDHLGASRRLRFTWTPNHLSLLMPLGAGI